jgi:simple sugar transport system ATP-binding protein
MAQVVAALREVIKAYPGTLASSGVSIEFRSGEVHALLGENGAGKSTLVKILAGLVQPNAGTIEVAGTPVRFGSARAARAAGIGVVHQAGSLIASMTVKENLLLSKPRLKKGRTVETGSPMRPAFPLNIPANRLVRDLSPRERQLIEIYRLLEQHVSLLVLDEPVATLSAQESDLLFRELRLLADAGYAVVVVSHKLPELLKHADRFTVLRKGQVVARLSHSEATPERVVALLNEPGTPARPELFALRAAGRQPPVCANCVSTVELPLMRFCKVSTAPSLAQEKPLQELDLTLWRGEILGITGRPGSGAVNILKLLGGEPLAITSGHLEWPERNGTLRPVTGISRIGVIPADRLADGVIAGLTVGENLALRRRHLFSVLKKKRRGRFAAEMIRRYDIRPASQDAPVGNLSGGNMQKVLLAREMEYADELLLATNPTVGLDIGSTEFVLRMLSEKAANDVCVVIQSDDLDELLAIASRIVVISDGRCVAELAGQQLTREAVGSALTGIVAPSVMDARKLMQEVS